MGHYSRDCRHPRTTRIQGIWEHDEEYYDYGEDGQYYDDDWREWDCPTSTIGRTGTVWWLRLPFDLGRGACERVATGLGSDRDLRTLSEFVRDVLAYDTKQGMPLYGRYG